MSLTLGEKLRQAREARGITLSEVADQTRISPLYIESIENDDYRGLPGGIFNKGFVKSFAKYVGVDEQEALQDYAALAGNQANQIVDEPKTYRPEVLTDDRSSSSSLSTIIFAVIILGLMAGGILFLLKYLQNNPADATTQLTNTTSEANANINQPSNETVASTPASNPSVPTMNDLKVEFKALNAPVAVTSTVDGKKSYQTITPDKPGVFNPKENLRLSYAKAQSQNVQMTVNGKQIALPAANPARNVIEFEITKEKLPSIWESGAVTVNAPAAAPR
jgi:cytoskeletal protein RodZ